MNDKFRKIDFETWERKDNYKVFTEFMPCGIQMNANVDITDLIKEMKRLNLRCYATFAYIITKIINSYDEFKTGLNKDGELVIFNKRHVRYPIFDDETKTVSILWSEYKEDFKEFYDNFLSDCSKYGKAHSMNAKGGFPENFYDLTSIPWTTFTSFNCECNVNKVFPPFVAIGKFFKQGEKILLPVNIKVHHAVCDGYHVSRFFEEFELLSKDFKSFINL